MLRVFVLLWLLAILTIVALRVGDYDFNFFGTIDGAPPASDR